MEYLIKFFIGFCIGYAIGKLIRIYLSRKSKREIVQSQETGNNSTQMQYGRMIIINCNKKRPYDEGDNE